jgi:hypothetical protein
VAKLFAPNGLPIRGTAETVLATAFLTNEDVTQTKFGTYEFAWQGGSEVWWDTQETIMRVNPETGVSERVFEDEDGEEWLESQLELREESENDTEEEE